MAKIKTILLIALVGAIFIQTEGFSRNRKQADDDDAEWDIMRPVFAPKDEDKLPSDIPFIDDVGGSSSEEIEYDFAEGEPDFRRKRSIADDEFNDMFRLID